MKRTLTTLGAVLALTAASVAVSAPATHADGPTLVAIDPQVLWIGEDNVLSDDDLAQVRAASNPPIYISNLHGYNGLAADLSYMAADLAQAAAGKTQYNYVTCSYGLSNWWDGWGTGTGDWTSTELFTAHVKGHDTALGVSTQTKTSTARAEVGIWLRSSSNWPTPSTATVDFRWAGNAYMQADSEFNPVTFGASAANATYMIDIELLAQEAGPRRNMFSKTIQPRFAGASASARPNVRWDDNASTPPTLAVSMGPNMDFKSKLVGSMQDNATPAIGANAAAGVDSWNQGNTYITGSQHWTFKIPRGYTLRECGGDGVILP